MRRMGSDKEERRSTLGRRWGTRVETCTAHTAGISQCLVLSGGMCHKWGHHMSQFASLCVPVVPTQLLIVSPFLSQMHPSLDDKLYGHLKYKLLQGKKST